MGLAQHKQTGAKKQEQLDRTNPLAHRHPQALTSHRQLFVFFFKKALKSCPQRSNHLDEAPLLVTRLSA
jgi:hypothetical protein